MTLTDRLGLNASGGRLWAVLALAGALLAFHAIFSGFFPLPGGQMGHDYALTLNGLIDGYLWFRNNGVWDAPWFTPSFCGGQPFFADPQSGYYSVTQWLFFVLSPLHALYASVLLFAAIGEIGMYRLARRRFDLGRAASVAAATVFLFNGFYIHRMIVGHFGYQPFMLMPWLALVLSQPAPKPLWGRTNAWAGLWVGLILAYSFHAGLATLVIPAVLGVGLILIVVHLTRQPQSTAVVGVRLLVGGAISVALSVSKLVAGFSLMSHFTRDYYKLPGVDSLAGSAQVVFQSLFYSSEHAFETATPLWRNMQWAAMPHELAFGLTPATLVVLLIGLGGWAMRLGNAPVAKPTVSQWVVGFVGLLVASIPLALMVYSPGWNAFLKSLPLIGSTTSPWRWLVMWLPLLALLAGMACQSAGRRTLSLSAALVVGVAALNALEDRSYYQEQNYPVGPAVAFYEAVASGQVEPKISTVDVWQNHTDLPTNALYVHGISQLNCYNPVFGYRLEKMDTSKPVAGPISEVRDGHFNLRNPACLVFPKENHCQLWDTFDTNTADAMAAFASYRKFTFQKSNLQQVADWVTGLSLLGVVVWLLFGGVQSARRRFNAPKA
jgi:hypothetical protein